MPVDNLKICKEVKIGDIFDEEIFYKWRKLVSKNKYINNAKNTFNIHL